MSKRTTGRDRIRRMAQAIADELTACDLAQLRQVQRAAGRLTATNCWWVEYALRYVVAHLAADFRDSLKRRRSHERNKAKRRRRAAGRAGR